MYLLDAAVQKYPSSRDNNDLVLYTILQNSHFFIFSYTSYIFRFFSCIFYVVVSLAPIAYTLTWKQIVEIYFIYSYK